MRIGWLLPLLIFLTACTSPDSDSNLGNELLSTDFAVTYTVQQTITLSNDGEGQPDQHNLWVALIGDVEPYQTVQSREISPQKFQIATDEYGNQYAEFDFKDHPAGTKILIEIGYQVTVFEQSIVPGICEGLLPDEFTQPELRIESANPQIVALSQKLSKGQDNPCDQVRAFYDYVGDELG